MIERRRDRVKRVIVKRRIREKERLIIRREILNRI